MLSTVQLFVQRNVSNHSNEGVRSSYEQVASLISQWSLYSRCAVSICVVLNLSYGPGGQCFQLTPRSSCGSSRLGCRCL